MSEQALMDRLTAPSYPRFTWTDAKRDICFAMRDGTNYRGKFLTCVRTDDNDLPLFVMIVGRSLVYLDDPELERWWWGPDPPR